MKDTIYREDAINCLCNGKCLDEMRWCDDGYCPPVTRIKQLPSAQPDWIPCNETVEIPDYEVLACNKYGEEILGYLEYTNEWICVSADCIMYDPIAWMEKPKPYIEKIKGRWVKENIVLTSLPPQYQWHCSECKKMIYGYSAKVLTNFCPNCGADMRGEL